MEKNQEKMVQVVKKLLALASNNPSQEEAMSASLKAQELMAKYHIEENQLMDRIEDSIDESTYDFDSKDTNNHKWKYTLSSIIAKNFRCEVYYMGKHSVRFYGYKMDTEVAKEVFGTLYHMGDKLGSREYSRAVKETGTGKGVYNSFITGFLKGIQEGLDKQCTALMIVIPKEVKETFQEKSKNWKSSSHQLGYKGGFSKEHYDKGVVKGRDAVDSRGIETSK